MKEKLFYLKNGRRLSGPFSQEQLDRMREKGLLMSGDMISENRVSWVSADDFFATEPEVNETVDETANQTVDEIELKEGDPEFIRPIKDFPHYNASEITLKEEKKTFILPDPVCSAIAMCWNASGQAANLYLARELASENYSGKPGHDSKLFSGTVIVMLVMIIGLTLMLTGAAMPNHFISVGIMPTVLFFAVALLIFIENLLLSIGMKHNKMIEMPLLCMQLQLIALPAFIGGLPLYALLICGVSNCPAVLTALIIIHSSFLLLYSLVNSAFGFWQINNHVFKFSRIGAVTLIIMSTVQHLMFYPIGFLLYKLIQN